MPRGLINQSVHSSWQIAAGSAGLVLGVSLAQYLLPDMFGSISWLLTGLALFFTSLWKSRKWMIVLAILGGVSIGLWRGSSVQAGLTQYKHYIGTTVELEGVVLEDSDTDKRSQTVLRLGNIVVDEHKLTGAIWVTTSKTEKIQRSDRVRIEGRLADGFGNFAATMYKARVVGIERPKPGDIALEVRNTFAEGARTAISEPEASLGLGYLVGQRRGLPEELDAALQAAGLTHIVVASGYNLTILVRFARRLFEKTSKYLSFISASGMIIGFITITGLSPSMSRAGLVAGLALIAWYYGRKFHPLVLLLFAMAITLLVQPSYAWGDLGWQLSFAAFAGVMILAPLIQAYFFADKPERTLRRIFIETISAQIATLPILLLAFGTFSVVAPIANILILPLVPIAMVLTFVAGLVGLLAPSIAIFTGLPAEWLLTYMTQTALLTGGVSWAKVEVSITIVVAIIFYISIIMAAMYMSYKSKYRLHDSSLVS